VAYLVDSVMHESTYPPANANGWAYRAGGGRDVNVQWSGDGNAAEHASRNGNADGYGHRGASVSGYAIPCGDAYDEWYDLDCRAGREVRGRNTNGQWDADCRWSGGQESGGDGVVVGQCQRDLCATGSIG
jgi:hypothetical protein